jgi:hypothetical protein
MVEAKLEGICRDIFREREALASDRYLSKHIKK